MANCTGDAVLGFSGSSSNHYVGAFYFWRLANGATAGQPLLIRDGKATYINSDGPTARWGDYSATTLDPGDDWSFWTVQQYAEYVFQAPDQFGTVVTRIRPLP